MSPKGRSNFLSITFFRNIFKGMLESPPWSNGHDAPWRHCSSSSGVLMRNRFPRQDNWISKERKWKADEVSSKSSSRCFIEKNLWLRELKTNNPMDSYPVGVLL